jgi:hypothetical protein
LSVAPESDRNRIMIYGPKPDGTYIIEFRMADGESPLSATFQVALVLIAVGAVTLIAIATNPELGSLVMLHFSGG